MAIRRGSDNSALWIQACYWLHKLEHGVTAQEFVNLAGWLAQPGAAQYLEDAFVTELFIMAALTRMMRLKLGQEALTSTRYKSQALGSTSL